jgi:hypothetical protein
MRFLILGLWAAAAFAYGADDPASRLLACAHVSADAVRLSCYDKLAAETATRQPTAPAAAAGSQHAPQQVVPRREFGLPTPQPAAVDVVKSVTAIVTAVHHKADGSVVVDLDNGQRWQQRGTADMGLDVGDTVTISRAMLGSFWLAPPSGRGSKVSRLQ